MAVSPASSVFHYPGVSVCEKWLICGPSRVKKNTTQFEAEISAENSQLPVVLTPSVHN
jgi:hypothetical protein